MHYTVIARCAAGRRAHEHASVLRALDQALSLAAAGHTDVAIIDGDGRSRSPGALYQALFGPQAAQVQAKAA